MVKVYPFAAVRPTRNSAPLIAAVPYDVVTAEEARAIIGNNPQSFLRVSRSDAELTGISPYDERVYQQARKNFMALMADGRMVQDLSPSLYLYRVLQDGEIFLGLACCLDVDDYRANRIRRHEQTRYDKEEDRTRHIEVTKTHNGPVVLLYRDTGEIFPFIESLAPAGSEPDAQAETGNGILHQIFRISDPGLLRELKEKFSRLPLLYIADGHHRAKSAVNVADRHPDAAPDDEVNRFLGVMFAHDRVRIHGYSRLLSDLGTYDAASFLDGLRNYFAISACDPIDAGGFRITPRIPNPDQFHVVHLYLAGRWYECTRRVDGHGPDPGSLDVAVIQKYILEDLLGITDPRGDPRLQYLGGARPIRDLMQLVDSGKYALAIAMQPVRVSTVLAIADAGGIMPPKSTWFEPKLLSGLVVHTFE